MATTKTNTTRGTKTQEVQAGLSKKELKQECKKWIFVILAAFILGNVASKAYTSYEGRQYTIKEEQWLKVTADSTGMEEIIHITTYENGNQKVDIMDMNFNYIR